MHSEESRPSKEEICKKSYDLLLEHHNQLTKILNKFANGKVPNQEDWGNVQVPFSKWKRYWDRVSLVWDSDKMEYVTRDDLKGDE